MKVLSGIITYNPDIKRLKENIKAVFDQVDQVLVIDNASDNVQDVERLLSEFPKILFIRNSENFGVAYALNQVAQYGFKNGFDWLLSLDQDSVISKDLIDIYKKNLPNDAGIICPRIVDRNYISKCKVQQIKLQEIDACITSASLTNVRAWKKVGGFDDKMFIDWVDWDFCHLLKEHGYKIYRANDAVMLHELGTKTRIKYFGKHEIMILNRNPFRYYYVERNRIYMAKKHRTESFIRAILRVLKDIFIVLIFESNRCNNIKAMLHGLMDGLEMKVEKIDYTESNNG